jgi:predicted 3-demethylubiquinone-9 3-methyltransferase (glyoxalase superfamily)
VSWQIVPKVLNELIGDPYREKSQRVMAAMLKVKKIEIAELERAAAAA